MATGLRKYFVAILVLGLIFLAYLRFSISLKSSTEIQPIENDVYSGVLIAETDLGQGSCFTVAYKDGWWYAITAAHVVDYSLDLTVDAEAYEAEIVRFDSEEDLALIRFQSPEDYRIYSFDVAKQGEFCTTVGWNGESQLLYKGYVVSENFRGQVASNSGVIPGCSGGVLLNSEYNVIGVIVSIPVFSESPFDSTALYVPSRFAKAMVVTITD